MTQQADIVSDDQIVSVVKGADVAELRRTASSLAQEQPFRYCVVRDSLESAIAHADNLKPRELLADAVRVRLGSLKLWRQEGNETVQAIQAGEISAESIKPHVRFEPQAYDKFYSDQSDAMAAKASRMGGESVSTSGQNYVAFQQSPNVNHSFRFVHAVSVVENLLGIVASLSEDGKKVRWMDIGCGTGHFANAVNPGRFGVADWEIVGCDMQAGKIAVAEKEGAQGRRFFTSDAFDMLKSYRTKGETFDLVSMFEFLEHLDDPLKFIRQLDTFKPRFVLAASPLGQKLNQPRDQKPDRVHLWSFGRQAWEQMFVLAGFSVVYSSETRVGSYIGGLDWLSVACGPAEELRARRQTLKG